MRTVRPATQPVPDALDLSLHMLAAGEGPALVVHRVAPAAITCGRAMLGSVDRQAVERSGLALVTRRSGGGPVLWDDDLVAIDVVLPTGDPRLPADVVAAYRWVGEAVAGALAGLGVADVRAVPPAEARAWPAGAAGGLCFGGLSPWEVVAGRRKVLGLSQVRRQAGSVIQVGVPMRLDALRLAAAVGAPAAAAADLAARTAGVGDLLPGTSRDTVERALVTALGGDHAG